MAAAKVYTMDGRDLGPIELNDSVFGVEFNDALVHEVTVALMGNARQGNADTKTRCEIRGGGKKPFRQKGTGNARQGSSREPQMKGGGTVFGPQPRSYRKDMPVRMRRQALCCALSDRVRAQALCVLDSLAFESPKTKQFTEMLNLIAPDRRKTLFVTTVVDENTILASRNLRKVTVKTAADINALDVLNANRVVLVRDAVAKLEERLS
jgi:large subunit ribosomal protein L4